MPRAPFDDVANIYAGQNTATPGLFKRAIPCRFILLPRELVHDLPYRFRVAYLTYQPPFLLASATQLLPPDITLFGGTADVVELQSNPGSFFDVLFSETVIPRFGVASYCRSHLQSI